MQEIPSFIETILQDDHRTVLAMIVDIDGSAYRKEGAWMIFKEDGTRSGMISGGCLENDLQERAKQLFHTGKTELKSYDMSAEDDIGWGRGAGCNGIVYVLLRDVDDKFKQALKKMHLTLQQKEPVLFIQSMENFERYYFQHPASASFDAFPKKWTSIKPFGNIAGQQSIENHPCYIQLIWPQAHIYIIGAGADARPLVSLAADAGFIVHVFDWRTEYCKQKHFPKAAQIHDGNLVEQVAKIPFSALDSVIIMTHDFQYDLALVHYLKKIDLFYCGILGSKKRTARLMDGEVPVQIQSPVGLSIGADGPVEIAISIVAQLIAKKRGKL